MDALVVLEILSTPERHQISEPSPHPVRQSRDRLSG